MNLTRSSPTPPMIYLILMSTSLSIFLAWPLAPNPHLSPDAPSLLFPTDGSWRCLMAAVARGRRARVHRRYGAGRHEHAVSIVPIVSTRHDCAQIVSRLDLGVDLQCRHGTTRLNLRASRVVPAPFPCRTFVKYMQIASNSRVLADMDNAEKPTP